MRLHVGVVGTEQLLGTLDGQRFSDVHVLAATVVSLAGIALGVLVGQYGSLRLKHARTRVVLRCDEFNVLFLTTFLVGNRLEQLFVEILDRGGLYKHGQRNSGNLGGIQGPRAGREVVIGKCNASPRQCGRAQAASASTTRVQARARLWRS